MLTAPARKLVADFESALLPWHVQNIGNYANIMKKVLSHDLKTNLVGAVVSFSLSLSVQEAKAGGGCPQCFVPIDGGYCRNIVCPHFSQAVWENEIQAKMKKYGVECPIGLGIGAYGDLIVPKR